MTVPQVSGQRRRRTPLPAATAPGTALAQPIAVTAVQAQAQMFRFSSALFGAGLIRDVLTLWLRLFDPAQARRSWPAVKMAVTELVHGQQPAAGRLGQQYYAQARAAAGAAGAFTAAGVPPVDAAVLSGTLDSTGPWTFLKSIQAGKTPQQALQGAGVRVSGAAARLVQQATRDVVIQAVQADPEAIGWARITAASPCAFCAMLASRGPVYKSAAQAGFKAHDHCQCTAAPFFTREDASLLYSKDLQAAWWKVTDGLSGANARLAWRRWWDANGKKLPG